MKNNVKKYREENRMTQEVLAEKSKVSRNVISKLENGQKLNLTKETMEKIAVDGLGKTILEVFFE